MPSYVNCLVVLWDLLLTVDLSVVNLHIRTLSDQQDQRYRIHRLVISSVSDPFHFVLDKDPALDPTLKNEKIPTFLSIKNIFQTDADPKHW